MTGGPGGSRCPRCGVEVAVGLGFCASCGEGLSASSYPGGAAAHGYSIGERVEDCEIVGPPQPAQLGERYPARDLTDGHAVELRVLRPAPGVRPARVQRFRAMLERLGSLNISGLQDLRRYSEEAGCFRLVLDPADGEVLSDRLVGPSGAPRSLERTLARSVLEAACETLAHVHESTVHGALWPSAIRFTLDRAGGLGQLWLDLPGTIWLLPDLRACARYTPITAPYLAPELLEGDLPAPPADVYGIGVLAYELITGRPPRGLAPPPSQLAARLPASVDRVIARALSERPAGRYASIGDLGRDLVAALGEPPPPAVKEEARVPIATLDGATLVPLTTLGAQSQSGWEGGFAEPLPPAPPPRPRRSGWSVLALLMMLLGLAAGGLALGWKYLPWSTSVTEPSGPAQLTIRTVPEGTSVNLDGEDLGYAPITLGRVAPGVTHFLRLSAEGHQLKVVEVRLAPGQRRVLAVRLEPEPLVR